MNLSKNLTLAEVTNSATAKRLGIDNKPTPEHLANLKNVAVHIFQPIRDHFNCPINVSSGYRCAALNKAVPGSSATSQHSTGEALDIDNDGMPVNNKMIFDFIRENLEFDQLIWEYGNSKSPDWVHVSYESSGKQRKQVLRCERVNGKPHYSIYK